jgi:hypothetical protein
VSIDQFIAVAEKMSALLTVEHLKERAGRGDRERFEAIMRKVPDGVPEVRDLL